MSFLFACQKPSTTKIEFVVKQHGVQQACDERQNLMWFVSEFQSDNTLSISPSKFSSESVALIGANCEKSSWQVELMADDLDGKKLSFSMAVPFNENHLNPLTATSPLNTSEMFWSWQLGHKFFRFDGDDGFSFHLGSTGCKSVSRLRAPSAPCAYPNRYQFELAQFDAHKSIILDLDRLFKQVGGSRSCMSEHNNPTCQQLFANLTTKIFHQE
ncbi:MbnP family protein [Pseudoalteromonas sp.]|uniref:MbnP family protein n=1 Tax=Pseudoalteromonas sp. TaxID=53249 RepID=UPI003569388C